MKKSIKVILGADHAGFAVKEKLKRYLQKKGFAVEDVGAYVLSEKDDYPEYAFKVAERVAQDRTGTARGVLVCHTGAGMVIAANKIKSIRAVEAYDLYSAKMSRVDNDSNVLSLHSHRLSFLKITKIISIWLKTPFSGEARHIRRVRKIAAYERK